MKLLNNKITKRKINLIKEELGQKVFQVKFEPDTRIEALRSSFELGKRVKIVGRVTAKRNACLFFNLRQEFHTIQCMCNNKQSAHIDLGDFIGVDGVCAETSTKEQTVEVEKVFYIAKAFANLPKPHFKISDELSYKEKTLHLLTDEHAFRVIGFRSFSLKLLRGLFETEGYLEVETPMLHKVPGGAEAQPFKTFHNETKKGLFLRVAPELYLKRMVTAGFEMIFEIGKSFRNEGISTKHNPEFTMLEAYASFKGLDFIVGMTEKAVELIIEHAIAKNLMPAKREKPLWSRMTFAQCVHGFLGKEVDIDDLETIRKEAHGKICFDETETAHEICDRLVDKYVKKHEFLHVTDHPESISPLAKSKEGGRSFRFESFIDGVEIANGYEEQTDPLKQNEVFVGQKKQNNKDIDSEYIKDMCYGMPNIVGLGIGIDRLIMKILGKEIKDVLMFRYY